MLLDEARLSARVIHPNVVRTLDVLEEGGDVFIVMEFARGVPLIRLMQIAVERQTSVPVDIAVGIMLDMLRGLHAAHEAVGTDGVPLGIVHRDVSPQNVIVGDDGTARLIDFGIAKARSRITTTEDGVAKGKQGYMAPEQLLGEPVGPETDVFGAGVVLWELLTGVRLFPAGDPRSAPAKRLSEEITLRPSEFREHRDTPSELDEIVLRALKKSHLERYPTARAMAEDLSNAVVPASPTTIAAWVEEIAYDELALLRDCVAQVERLAQQEDSSRHQVFAPLAWSGDASQPELAGNSLVARGEGGVPVETQHAVTRQAPPPPSADRKRSLVTALALLTFAASVALLVGTRVVRSKTERDGSTPPIESSAVGTATPIGEAVVEAIVKDTDSVIAEPSEVTSKVLTTSSKRTASPKGPPPTRYPRPAKAKSCTPPYTFDDEGHKIFKPECF